MAILNQISNKIFAKKFDLEKFSLSLDCEKLMIMSIKKLNKKNLKTKIIFILSIKLW